MLSGATGSGTTAAALGVTVLHIAFSVLVTTHVLLRKRDIGASIGWIGLAWLSPFIGSALYYLLGINRVRERARTLKPPHDVDEAGQTHAPQHHEDDPLAAIDRTAYRLTRRAAEPGNTVVPLHNGDEAYPRMLAAIDAAVTSIGLSSYILRDDAAGGPIIDALIRAHRRGVAAQVLIDGIGSGYFRSSAYRRLRQSGVPVARFMHSPLPWKMPFLNLRSHKKILVIDSRVGFTGGLNIGRENLLRSDPPDPVRDTHFAFHGPVVSQLADAFARDWQFVNGDDIPARDRSPGAPGAGEAAARVVTSGPDQDLEKIELLALQAITCARRSVRIMTPYFLPDERLVTVLALAAMRGVEVDIIVPERSNHRYLDWGTRAHVGPLLTAGCRVWYNPPPFDHSKLMVVDGGWSLVGSSNWDMRSLRLNFELDVELYGSAFAGVLTDIMLQKRGRLLDAAELEERSLPVRLRDAAMRLLLPYI